MQKGKYMRLSDINDDNINAMLRDHATDGGDLINKSLLKLFNLFNDETNKYEVQIKVAALNQLYSTAIQYITPVVSKIVAVYKKIDKPPSLEGYCDLVDKIAAVKWVSLSTGKQHERNNLSFASKYVHFLSQCKTLIFDSYKCLTTSHSVTPSQFQPYSLTSWLFLFRHQFL